MNRISKILLLIPALLSYMPTEAHTTGKEHTHATVETSKNGIFFIENRGQWDSRIRYRSGIPGGSMFITDSALIYNFSEQISCSDTTITDHHSRQIKGHAYKISFLGAAPGNTFHTKDKKSFYHNYFVGPDSSSWKGKVPLFGTVTRQNLYPGIDLVIYTTAEESVKYDLIIAPGADITQVRLGFDGVSPELTSKGDLKITTSINEITEKAPVSYQEINGKKIRIKSRYRLHNGELSFEFPKGYDTTKTLIIDPELVFASYSGSTGSAKYSYSAAYNKEGSLFAASLAYDDGWPVTMGAYQTSVNVRLSIVLSKFTPDGSSMEYATYFAGGRNGMTYPNTLRINDSDEAVIAGATTSGTLPITQGAHQQFLNGRSDIFLARFSSDGSQLLGSTYVGGSGQEATLMGKLIHEDDASPHEINPCDIAFDHAGNIWVSSNTGSANFPVTTNGLQSALRGSHDVVLFKINKELTTLLYATYIGGTGWDGGIAIEYDEPRDLIGTVGYTVSPNFPVTSNAHISTQPGGTDGFALLLNNSDYTLHASTYLGTSGSDVAIRLAFDCNGNMYASGSTNGNYPTTGGSGQMDSGGVFIDKLAPDLSRSLGSTRTGINYNRIMTSALMVDVCGNVFVSTITGRWLIQNGMPLTANAFMTWPATPFYFVAFKPDFSELLFSTYLGRTQDHFHPGVSRMDPKGFVYQSICTYENDWPVTPNSFAPVKRNSGVDNINFKFRFDLYQSSSTRTSTGGGANATEPHCVRGCKSAFVHFDRVQNGPPLKIRIQLGGNAINGTDYEWIPDSVIIPQNHTSASLEIKPLLVPQVSPPDPRYVVINRLEPCECNRILSSDTIWIYDSLYVKMISPPETICPGDTIIIEADIDPELGYTWSPRNMITEAAGLTITAAPHVSTTFQITAYQKGSPPTCPARTARYPAIVEQIPEFSLNETHLCLGEDSLNLEIIPIPEESAYRYKWEPADWLRNDSDRVNKFSPPGSGVYKKYIRASTPVAHCSVTDTIEINVLPAFEFAWLAPEDTTIFYGDSLRLQWQGTSIATKWTWSHVPDTFTDESRRYPFVRPLTPTAYTITAYNEYGCPGKATMNVRIDMNSRIFIPNAFTPNGDGLNDVFRIKNIRFEKLDEFRIYNRLGQVVFTTQDPDAGWDGSFKGAPCETGSYFYFARVQLPGGKVEELKGDISLIR